ncbi:MAG: hypothetical protein V3571_07255 [Pseudodesulfovibrio sp.]
MGGDAELNAVRTGVSIRLDHTQLVKTIQYYPVLYGENISIPLPEVQMAGPSCPIASFRDAPMGVFP